MPAIFISYASRDQHDADRIVHALEARGLKCWMSSRDIPFGQDYQAHIVAAIEAARVMLVLLSRHSAASKEVPKETGLASEINLAMIPVRIDASELTGALRLQSSSTQRVDLSSDFAGGIDKLARQLARLLDMEESTEKRLRALAARRRAIHVLAWPVALCVVAVVAFEAWQFAPIQQWLREQAALVLDRRTQPQAEPEPSLPTTVPAPIKPAAPDFHARAADFVQRYYAAMSGPDEELAPAIQEMASDPIKFLGIPLQRRVLMAQSTAYGKRWPNRTFTAHQDSLQVSCNMASVCSVSGIVDYDLNNGRGVSSSGRDRFDMRVSFAGPSRLMSIDRAPLQRHP